MNKEKIIISARLVFHPLSGVPTGIYLTFSDGDFLVLPCKIEKIDGEIGGFEASISMNLKLDKNVLMSETFNAKYNNHII